MAEDAERDLDLLAEIRAGAIGQHQLAGIPPGDQAREAERALLSRGRLLPTNLSLATR